MHYIIDGYNLFFRLAGEFLPLDKKRESFIASLNHEITAHQLNVTLIFDSGMTHKESFPSKKELEGVEVGFSPQGLSADEYILEFLCYQKQPQNKVIVTSDRELAKKASFLGAKTQTIDVFLKRLLRRKKKGKTTEKKKHLCESDANIARLLVIFEKRLKDEPPD